MNIKKKSMIIHPSVPVKKEKRKKKLLMKHTAPVCPKTAIQQAHPPPSTAYKELSDA